MVHDDVARLRAVRDRLVARAFTFDHPREYVAGIDDLLRAVVHELGVEEDPTHPDATAAML